MNIFENKFPSELYHSYIIEGNSNMLAEQLLSYFIAHGMIIENSPDVLFQSYDSFTINESRTIKEWHSQSSTLGGKRFCILSMKFINHDAERSLLKILEEPAHDTHIFILIPQADTLLDTIRSRAHVIKMHDELSSAGTYAKDFVSLSPRARIYFVTELVKKHKEVEGSGLLRHEAIELINGIEIILFENFQKNFNNKELQFALEEIAKCRGYLSLPGASVKMILEHIALVL